MKINAVKEGYYKIVEGGITIAQKASEVEAIQGLINYKLEGRDVTMVPPTYRVDIDNHPMEEEIFFAEGYIHLTAVDGTQYIRVGASREIIRLSGEAKARDGQGKFILKRIQSSDWIDTYEIYGPQPFEIENDHEVVDYETGYIRLWATEPWRIEYLVNGVRDDVASDPVDLAPENFNSSLTEEDMYRHTRKLNATYGDKIEIFAYNAAGESDSFGFYIETLHQLDQSARIKALNQQIIAIMNEPEPQK